MTPARGLKLVSLPPGTGYGDAAAQYAAGLDALGVPVSWHPVHFASGKPVDRASALAMTQDGIRSRLARLHRQDIEYDVFLLDLPPPALHRRLLDEEDVERAFAYVAWEVDELPGNWPPALNVYDRVFTPSRFNRETFLAHGIEVPVDVIPHVARPIEPVGDSDILKPVAGGTFLFYSIGTWTTRKAQEETVRAYLDAFTAEDNVTLVLKTDALDHIEAARLPARSLRDGPGHLATTWWALARILADYVNPARVHLINLDIAPRDIDFLHDRAHCYVSLTRSEGWGLTSFDALLSGNPVIMPNCSGQADYLGGDYPLSVRHRPQTTLSSPNDNGHLRSDTAHWADADRGHATELMRWVFEHPEQARQIARERQADLARRFAAPRVCAKLAELMGFETPVLEPAHER